MSIAPIPAIGLPFSPPGATAAPRAATAADTGATSFGDTISRALDNLSTAHAEVDRLAVGAATGDLNAVHDFTIAATEAQLMTQLTVEVRNRAIESFNDIMRMQV